MNLKATKIYREGRKDREEKKRKAEQRLTTPLVRRGCAAQKPATRNP